jgi:uncharacterized protein (TIGR03067 family)
MMLKHLYLLALLLIAVDTVPMWADPPKELSDAARKELKTLEGKWRVVRFVHSDRETAPEDGDDPIIVEFRGDTIDFAGSANGMVVDLEPAANPKGLDFMTRMAAGIFKKDSTCESVYKLDGNTLTWALYTGRDKNRPTSFNNPTEAGGIVIELKRLNE